MLALDSARQPLVNPAAFYFASGSILMTTSRYAAKLALLRRDPRASFAVTGADTTVVLTGVLEAFDPLSLSGQVRAALAGPGFWWGMGGYTMKNAPFVGGYLLELAQVPGQWWPQNRVMLRLRVDGQRVLPISRPPDADDCLVPEGPPDVARALSKIPLAYVCWRAERGVDLAPAWWSVSGGRLVAVPATREWPSQGGVGAMVVESHHSIRATRMVGVCSRGLFKIADPSVASLVAERYGLVAPQIEGPPLLMDPIRLTWWRGFEVGTQSSRETVRTHRRGPSERRER
jgi:hypothetical protein